MKHLVAIAAIVAVTPFSESWALYSVTGEQTKNQSVSSYLSSVESLLPQKMKSALKEVKVNFKDLGSEKHAGYTKNNRANTIVINSHYLKDINMSRSRSNMLMATVLHETMHQYDFKSKLSQDVYFDLIVNEEDKKINFSFRTMDAYELKNKAENLATNFEGFMLDPEFKCRRPTMYEFLKQKLEHEPFANVACDSRVPLVKSDDGKIETFWLDPARVYEVHYLFASKGEAAMSRWGHAMLRLIVCDPKRESVGPDCLKDVNSHLVLSFQAVVNGLKIDSLAGMKGKYPSRLNIGSIYTTARQYNMGERRDVISMPLKMNRSQVERLLRRTSEYQWTYDGSYRFFTNNCADETMKLLKIAFLNNNFVNVKLATPLSLYEKLQSFGMADSSILAKPEAEQIEKGYLFKSYLTKYENSFKVAKEFMPQLAGLKKVTDYLKLPSDVRADHIEVALANQSKDKRRIVAAMLLLEMGALLETEAKAKEQLMKILDRAEKKNRVTEQMAFYERMKAGVVDFAAALDNTFLLASGGYGLPNESEVSKDVKVNESVADTKKVIEGMKELEQLLDANIRHEIEQGDLNYKTLLNSLKAST